MDVKEVGVGDNGVECLKENQDSRHMIVDNIGTETDPWCCIQGTWSGDSQVGNV